jgi:tetratricopeptide (TPR) repeat protein
MAEGKTSILAQWRRPRVFLPAILLFVALMGGISYGILLNPNSIFVRWAQAALPHQITMISFGPYPEERDFGYLKRERVKYIVSLLDPRLPYEKELITREQARAAKFGMTVKVFPMASIFDRRIFPDYAAQQKKAVEFLQRLDGPAYVHCYLGKHRVVHVRDELIEAGVPKRYWTPASSQQEYWDLLDRVEQAHELFRKGDSAKVLEVLASVPSKDLDVTYLRGWSHYRLGMVDEAAEDFRQGLELDPTNPRNLLGSGYCYLRQGRTTMAQRQFSAILEQIPDEPGALTGMGLTHLRLGNKAAAAHLFRQALSKEPENEEVKGYLHQAEAS